MGKRYSYFVMFLLLLVIMARWASMPEVSSAALGIALSPHSDSAVLARGSVGGLNLDRRQALLEWTDRAVRILNYRRSVSGEFPARLADLGIAMPPDLQGIYSAELSESGRDHFKLLVNSRVETEFGEHLSVDQNFKVLANFRIPLPRADYLKQVATFHLSEIQKSKPGQIPSEAGIFVGFFRFQQERVSSSDLAWTAVGIQHPVDGVHLSLGQTPDASAFASIPFASGMGELGSWKAPTNLSSHPADSIATESTVGAQEVLGLRNLAAWVAETGPDSQGGGGRSLASSQNSEVIPRRVNRVQHSKAIKFKRQTADGLEIESIDD